MRNIEGLYVNQEELKPQRSEPEVSRHWKVYAFSALKNYEISATVVGDIQVTLTLLRN